MVPFSTNFTSASLETLAAVFNPRLTYLKDLPTDFLEDLSVCVFHTPIFSMRASTSVCLSRQRV